MKKSVTGLMTMDHEVKRLENLFHKQEGSAYYLKDYGVDWRFFQNQQMDIPVGSLLSYFTQKAMAQGIVILEQNYKIEDFMLKVTSRLLSEEVTFTTGIQDV